MVSVWWGGGVEIYEEGMFDAWRRTGLIVGWHEGRDDGWDDGRCEGRLDGWDDGCPLGPAVALPPPWMDTLCFAAG